MPVTKQCKVCNKEFSVPPWRAETAVVCSRACKGALTAAKYQEQRVTHRCKWCDKEFTSPQSHAHRRAYCSEKCKNDAGVGQYFGPRAEDGGTTMHSDGYVLERSNLHPFAVSGEVMQHRLVMERWMREEALHHHFLVEIDGVKYLRREIHVHHRNEIKGDNARGNLLACTAATHKDIHSGRPVMKGTAWPETGDEIDAEARSVIKPCEICGVPFKAIRANLLRGAGKYCSIKCRGAGQTLKSKTK